MVACISPNMKKFSVLIYRCCRLRSGVAIRRSEIKGADAVGAEGACECRATAYRFDCVISHTIILFLMSVAPWSRCMTIVCAGLPETGFVELGATIALRSSHARRLRPVAQPVSAYRLLAYTIRADISSRVGM